MTCITLIESDRVGFYRIKAVMNFHINGITVLKDTIGGYICKKSNINLHKPFWATPESIITKSIIDCEGVIKQSEISGCTLSGGILCEKSNLTDVTSSESLNVDSCRVIKAEISGNVYLTYSSLDTATLYNSFIYAAIIAHSDIQESGVEHSSVLLCPKIKHTKITYSSANSCSISSSIIKFLNLVDQIIKKDNAIISTVICSEENQQITTRVISKLSNIKSEISKFYLHLLKSLKK